MVREPFFCSGQLNSEESNASGCAAADGSREQTSFGSGITPNAEIDGQFLPSGHLGENRGGEALMNISRI